MSNDLIFSVSAFLLSAITNVFVFLRLAKDIERVTFPFCLLLAVTSCLWTLHGAAIKDVSLLFSASLGLLTSLIILGVKLFAGNGIKKKS